MKSANVSNTQGMKVEEEIDHTHIQGLIRRFRRYTGYHHGQKVR